MANTPAGGEATWLKRWPDWVDKATEKHSGRYTYPDSTRVQAEGDWKINVVCPEHGTFLQSTRKHMWGRGCPQCAGRGTDKRGMLELKFPDWDFKDLDISRSKGKLRLHCESHGEFATTFNKLMGTPGTTPCPECNHQAAGLKRRRLPSSWVAQVEDVHGDRVSVDSASITTADRKATFVCGKHGEFRSVLQDVVTGHGCPKCSALVSGGEACLRDWLSELGFTVVGSDRSTLENGEIDILLPEQGIGIEYCGLYWHSEKYRGAGYHRNKMMEARKAGVRLITVFEDEWILRPGHVKAQLMGILGLNETKNARETTVRRIEWAEAKEFLELWHMNGAGIPAPIRYGLYEGSRLLSVMTLGRARFEGGAGHYEMYRYCGGEYSRVRGGMSKLLARIYAENPGIVRLTTYADMRWGTGKGYEAVGFKYVGDTKPGYYWCKGLTRLSRHVMQKHRLPDMLSKFDPEASEAENCKANGYARIWDCGSSKWEMKCG